MSTRRFVVFFLFALGTMLNQGRALAKIHTYRWTTNPEVTDDFGPLIEKLNLESGLSLKPENFQLIEERDLAYSHFKTYVQTSQEVAIGGALIRTWSEPKTRAIIQMEAHVDDGSENIKRTQVLKSYKWPLKALSKELSAMNTMAYVHQVVSRHPDDRRIMNVKWKDEWRGLDLQRVIHVKGRRGTHEIVVSHFSRRLISTHYEEFPQADIPALVYPIYENAEGDSKTQERITVLLKNILSTRRMTDTDPYASLRTQRYFEDMINPVLGETPEGREQGYWSPNWLLRTARALFEALPVIENSFSNGGIFLEGKYATINLHPDAVSNLKGIQFRPSYSGQLAVIWKPSQGQDGQERWEVIPTGAYYGRPLTDITSALLREARRLPDHDPVAYINDGFDEIQVYYAIDRLMESLHQMGFVDPELSTRPFHAFLYDPDISMRDNAYYTNDTINFTTYSPDAQNYARDNSTIWHELGHGVMDRLMGDMIRLADSGGLAEGMADFIAQLVIEDVTNGAPFDGSNQFRIINQTGFHLTNESHDDGEAYGGAMRDILTYALRQWGRDGLAKMTDLTLETMRLTRNHPALTANDWFEHMLYADQLGRPGLRAPNEMNHHIVEALRSRNFRMDRGPVAAFNVRYQSDNSQPTRNSDADSDADNKMPDSPSADTTELTSDSPGSRYKPLTHELAENEEVQYELTTSLTDSEVYQFHFPVRVEVHFTGGPLQGAVRWLNENEGPVRLTLRNAGEMARFKLGARGGCDFVNREDGSCSDFAYLLVFNQYGDKPVAKKRFYVRIKSRI